MLEGYTKRDVKSRLQQGWTCDLDLDLDLDLRHSVSHRGRAIAVSGHTPPLYHSPGYQWSHTTPL